MMHASLFHLFGSLDIREQSNLDPVSRDAGLRPQVSHGCLHTIVLVFPLAEVLHLRFRGSEGHLTRNPIDEQVHPGPDVGGDL